MKRNWLFVALALAALMAIGIAKGATERAKDYHVYDRAADRLVAGESMYVQSDRPMPFKYPPPAGVMLVPFGVLPRALGGALWNALSVLALAFSIWRWRASALEASLAIACLFQSLFLVMDHGQADLLILALLTWAVFLREERPRAAGVAWAAACLLKPPAGLLLLAFAWERRWKLIAASIATGIVGLCLVAVPYGVLGAWDAVLAWRGLLADSTAVWLLRHDAQGLPSLFLTFWVESGSQTSPSETATTFASLLAIGLFVALLAFTRPRGTTLYAALMLGVALLSPQAWRANFVLALPFIVLVAREWNRSEPRGWKVPATLLAVFAVQLVFGEGVLPDRYLDPALAAFRPFALAFSLLLLVGLSPPLLKSNRGSVMSLAPRR